MSPTPSLRRSARTAAPKVVFTIDNTPPHKRKKTTASPSPVPKSKPVEPPKPAEPPKPMEPIKPEVAPEPVKVEVPTPKVEKGAELTEPTIKTEPEIPRTTYSNQSIDTVRALRNQGKQMTLKQLLSRNFTNYKARPSMTSERAVALVNKTLSENDVPMGALLSGPPQIPNNVVMGSVYQPRKDRLEHTLQTSLVALVKNARIPETPVKPAQTLKMALDSLVVTEDHTEAEKGLEDITNHILSTPSKGSEIEKIAYPGNHLPWRVIWKQVPIYTQGDIYCYVSKCTYTPMSAIIKSGNFMVPLDKKVPVVFEEKTILVNLEELLTANGVNLNHTALHYRMLQGLLQKAGVHVRTDFAMRLLEFQAVKEGRMKKEELNLTPIELTLETLPLMCIHPDIYMRTLGRRIHGAVIVDTSGDREPLPGQTFLTTVYSEPLPFDLRRQILIRFDAGIEIEQIIEKVGCTRRTVLETIGTRILIDRQIINEHLLEYPDSPASPGTITASSSSPSSSSSAQKPTLGEMMRPKSKIRRTHYVDLNKLVWKHFKDCQASGVQINGKHLKDQAMRYAKEMGLESFRGSEGWLDAFKRRHRIDLKSMTGYPVCYENDMFDEVDKECRELDMESHLHHQNSHHQSAPSFFGQGVSSAPEEFASSFFSSLNGFPQQMLHHQHQPEPTSSSTHLQNMINSMMTTSTLDQSRMMMPSTSTQDTTSDESSGETIFNVMRSCQIKVVDKDVSHALDTLRAYILAHDPAAMSLLVPLQERLSQTAATNLTTEDPSTSSA